MMAERSMLYRLKPIFQTGAGNTFEQKVADLIPAILFVFDGLTGTLTYLSNQISSILGYKEDELDSIRQNILALVHRDDINIFQRGVCALHAPDNGTVNNFRCRLLSQTKQPLYFQVSATVLHHDKNGQAISFLCMAQEIEGIHDNRPGDKALLSAMAESEKMLRSGTVTWDDQMTHMHFSPGMFTLMGYNNQSLASYMPASFLYQHTRQEEIAFVRSKIENATRHQQKDEFTFSLVTTNDETLIIAASLKPAVDADGGISIIGVFHDITMIKRMETDLEMKIKELNRSNADLEEFAYVSSHDLQEPLRKISTFSERLESKFAEQLSDEGLMYLRRMGAATGHMRRLIDNLLDFSRLARNNQPFASTDLNTIVAEVRSELELKLEESGAQLDIGKLPVIDAINSQVRQLFANLLSNAIKFTKPGQHPHISIKAKLLNKEAVRSYGLHSENNYYAITVKDDGIGFDPVYAERIFQLFQRLHGKEEYPGTGIGLAICKKIAENHGGIISAVSQPDKGATFTIILPEKQ